MWKCGSCGGKLSRRTGRRAGAGASSTFVVILIYLEIVFEGNGKCFLRALSSRGVRWYQASRGVKWVLLTLLSCMIGSDHHT